jgi:hypothetical protein
MWPWTLLTTINSKLDSVLSLLRTILRQEIKTVQELDDLQVQVKANTDAEASAILLLGQLHDLIVAAGTDPAKLKALADALAASQTNLAAAIVANTPAAP